MTNYYSSSATELFLRNKPTLVADFSELLGVRLYECPHFGDERPLKAVVNCEGNILRTVQTSIHDLSDKSNAAIQVADFKRELMNERPEWFE